MIDASPSPRTESASELRLVLDALPIGVVALDEAGVVRIANRAAAAQLDVAGDELVGTVLAGRLPELAAPLAAAAARVLRRPRGGEPRVLVLAEHALADPPAGLRRLVTLHALGDAALVERDPRSGLPVDATTRIVGGLAHELRNPLASVQALAEVLLVGLDAQDPQHECATRIRREVGRIEAFVRAAVGLTQVVPNQAAPQEPLALLAAASALAATAGRLALPRAVAPDLRCACDREQIVACLAAVVTNAFEAEPGPGGVSVAVERCRDLEGRPWLRFAVEDDGCGVPPRHRGKVFEPFFTTKPGRLGFGLALARRQAVVNGGRLELVPREPRGTRCELWLPEASR